MAVATPSGGVWRTIHGARVLLKPGQTPSQAFAASGRGDAVSAEATSEGGRYTGNIRGMGDFMGVSSAEVETQLDAVAQDHGFNDMREVVAAGVPDSKMFPEVEVYLEGSVVQVIAVGRGKTVMERRLNLVERTVSNDLFRVDESLRGKGVGTALFAAQVRNASDAGFTKMETYAARSHNENGYYTWPRLGYDSGSLKPGSKIMGMSDNSIAEMRRFAGTNTPRISDLMKTAEGRSWWKENGVSLKLTFDLTPGSQSRQVLDAYVAAKKGT